jgi:hypothetical protein
MAPFLAAPNTRGRFHRDGVNMAELQPLGKCEKVGGETTELSHALLIAVRRNSYENLFCAMSIPVESSSSTADLLSLICLFAIVLFLVPEKPA